MWFDAQLDQKILGRSLRAILCLAKYNEMKLFLKKNIYQSLKRSKNPYFLKNLTTPTKGQLFFKMSFWYLQISQKTNEIFSRISALASKKMLKSKK